ncbi:MAG: mechanosensitive ion channel family protein [Elusimicrobiaceae bacterium]
MNYYALSNYTLYGNSAHHWLYFFIMLLITVGALKLFKSSVIAYLKKLAENTETELDDFLLELFEKRVYPYFYFMVFYFCTRYLELTPSLLHKLNVAAKVALMLMVISVIAGIVTYMCKSRISKTRTGNSNKKEFSGIITLVNIVIWGFGAILILDNLGVKVSTVVAGMGIGGVAVALASQTMLKDLFSYFAILFDRPFEVGDFVVAGEHSGTIEYIGIKTTRIRSLGGEEIVCANSSMVENTLHNYKRMARRRAVIKFSVAYETPVETLKQLPLIIRKIVETVPGITFDRAHLSEYGAFSLNYEVVYYVEDADYTSHMDKQQEIILRVKEDFLKLGVVFPYPTQTLYVGNRPPLAQK